MCPTSETSLGKDTFKIWDIPNEPVYETIKLLNTENRLPQMWRTDSWFPRGRRLGEGWTASLGLADVKC